MLAGARTYVTGTTRAIGESWTMSATSIKNELGIPASVRGSLETVRHAIGDRVEVQREPSVPEMLLLANWRNCLLEIVALLVVISFAQQWLFSLDHARELPHPYWIPVLLASSQYGLSGGLMATCAASVAFWFGLPPPSATQDFYAYAAMVAVQPGTWLASALILGGLRTLHIHQSGEIANELALCCRHAADVCDGFERALEEINALEQRIAIGTASVGALSRGLTQLDLSDRRTAASSFGELFRVGAGLSTFTIYLKEGEFYIPVYAVEDDIAQATTSMQPRPATTIDAMLDQSVRLGATYDVTDNPSTNNCCVVRVPSADVAPEPVAIVVCTLSEPPDDEFRRRAGDLGRVLATFLTVCRPPSAGGCS